MPITLIAAAVAPALMLILLPLYACAGIYLPECGAGLRAPGAALHMSVRQQTQPRRDTSAQRTIDLVERVGVIDDLKPESIEDQVLAGVFDVASWSESTLRDLVQRGGGGRSINGVTRPSEAELRGRADANEQTFVDTICRTDAVVVARVESRHAMLTKNEAWLFTKYGLSAIASIRGPIGVGERFAIADSGGEVRVNGIPLKVSREPLPLAKVGDTYAFALARLRNVSTWALAERLSPVPVSLQISDSDYVGRLQSIVASCVKPTGRR
jgi:hypothetical protein